MRYFSCIFEGVWMPAYSQDLRDRVLGALDRGDRPTEIARRFEVSRIWVYQVGKRARTTGERSSLRIGGYRQARVAEAESGLRSWVAGRADLTLGGVSR